MGKNAVLVKLYRILLREVRDLNKLEQKKVMPVLQRILDPREYGHAYLFDLPRRAYHPDGNYIAREDDVLNFFDQLMMYEEKEKEDDNDYSNDTKLVFPFGPESSVLGITPKLLESSIKKGFRVKENLDTIASQGKAISVIRELNSQLELWKQTSVFVDEERNISCMATGSCIGRTSEHISSGRFFAYRVRIENRNDPDTSDTTVQLLGRHWKIYDDRKNILNRVDAPTTGAVGYHPVLRPGQGFEYMSGTEITSPIGYMDGSFEMVQVDKDTKSARVGDDLDAFEDTKGHFQLKVEPFQLIA